MKARNIFTGKVEIITIIEDRISALQKHKIKLNFRFITDEEKPKKITDNKIGDAIYDSNNFVDDFGYSQQYIEKIEEFNNFPSKISKINNVKAIITDINIEQRELTLLNIVDYE